MAPDEDEEAPDGSGAGGSALPLALVPEPEPTLSGGVVMHIQCAPWFFEGLCI